MKKALSRNILLAIIAAVSLSSCVTQKNPRKDQLVTLETTFGTTHLILFDDTPLHKANFLKLAKAGFYDGLLFHRIIDNFMIQGGDPNSRNADASVRLGSGGGDMEKIPFEFTPKHVHKRGALAAAHDGNPEKKSSATQFYIVDGKPYSDDELTMLQKKNNIDYTTQQRADYMIIGGYAPLDTRYTVFGEAIDNLELIDKIATQPKNNADRPDTNITMKMSVKKMRKKKITKLYGYEY